MSNKYKAKRQAICHSLLSRTHKSGYASDKEIRISIKFGKALNRLSYTEYEYFIHTLQEKKS